MFDHFCEFSDNSYCPFTSKQKMCIKLFFSFKQVKQHCYNVGYPLAESGINNLIVGMDISMS